VVASVMTKGEHSKWKGYRQNAQHSLVFTCRTKSSPLEEERSALRPTSAETEQHTLA